jgi:hypothetical protein
MTRVKKASQEPIRAGLRTSEIKQMKEAARLEDPTDLTQCLQFHFRIEMMEHKGGEHSIEGLVGIRKVMQEPLIELYRDRRSLCFASCSGQCFRIRIEPNYSDVGMKSFDNSYQCAGAAADLKNVITRPDAGLIDEFSSGPIATKQFHEWVVERQ